MQPRRQQTRTARGTKKEDEHSSACSGTDCVGLCHGRRAGERGVDGPLCPAPLSPSLLPFLHEKPRDHCCPPLPGSPWWGQRGVPWASPERLPNPVCPSPCPPSCFSQAKSWQRSTRCFVGAELDGRYLQSGGAAPGCPAPCPPPGGDPRALNLALSRKAPLEGVGAAGAGGRSFAPPAAASAPAAQCGYVVKNIKQ